MMRRGVTTLDRAVQLGLYLIRSMRWDTTITQSKERIMSDREAYIKKMNAKPN